MLAARRSSVGLGAPVQAIAVTALIAGVTLALAGRANIPPLHVGLALALTLSLPIAAFIRSAAGPLGWANTVTLLRLSLAALVLAGLPQIVAADPPIWLLAGVATTAWLLDAVDGWLARALREVSAFGARLDMETDSLLLIACTLVLVTADRVGPWILVAGLLRPLFVLAGAARPWLARPLPGSWRRKALCAIPLGLIILAMLPPLPLVASVASAVVALALLATSFAIDLAWLWRQHRPGADADP